MKATRRKYSARRVGLELPEGDGDGSFGPRGDGRQAERAVLDFDAIFAERPLAVEPGQVMNWYLFLILTVPAARSTGSMPIHW